MRYTFSAFGWDSHARAAAAYSSKNPFVIRRPDLAFIPGAGGDTTVDLSVGAFGSEGLQVNLPWHGFRSLAHVQRSRPVQEL